MTSEVNSSIRLPRSSVTAEVDSSIRLPRSSVTSEVCLATTPKSYLIPPQRASPVRLARDLEEWAGSEIMSWLEHDQPEPGGSDNGFGAALRA